MDIYNKFYHLKLSLTTIHIIGKNTNNFKNKKHRRNYKNLRYLYYKYI